MRRALIDLVERVGAQLVHWRDTGGAAGHWEGTQFKADADARAHDALVAGLRVLDPVTPIVSEEDDEPSVHQLPERCFLVDPIDGTASYAHGFAGFVTQVALIETGQPVAAAVHAPAFGVTWSAERGHGAFLGDRRLAHRHASGRLLVIDNYPQPQGAAERLVMRLPATGYVECGSIALKACRVADDTADVFAKDVPVQVWDVAPADLILREVGAWISDRHGRPFVYDAPGPRAGVIAVPDPQLARRVQYILDENNTDD
jgi:3'(2'), 5'-bisphosphate nucleotidase